MCVCVRVVALRRLGRAWFLLHRPITLAEVQNLYIIHPTPLLDALAMHIWPVGS